MSLQTLGFRVVKRGEAKPGRTPKVEPLSRLYPSRGAAEDFLLLAKRQLPDADVYIDTVQGHER